jgi:hypothetical protein
VGLEAETTGWIAFGVGETGSGSMPGADIAICSNNNGAGIVSVGDYHTTDFAPPIRDGQEDWTLLSSFLNTSRTVCPATSYSSQQRVTKLEKADVMRKKNTLETLFAQLQAQHSIQTHTSTEF